MCGNWPFIYMNTSKYTMFEYRLRLFSSFTYVNTLLPLTWEWSENTWLTHYVCLSKAHLSLVLVVAEMTFWLLGAYCSLYLKFIFNILENVKNIETKILCVHLHIVGAHKVVLRKKLTFYVAYVKMTKFATKISLFTTCFFYLFCKAQKWPFFTKLCARI
jgi:hypothetical protein